MNCDFWSLILSNKNNSCLFFGFRIPAKPSMRGTWKSLSIGFALVYFITSIRSISLMNGLLQRWIERRVIDFLKLAEIISNMGVVMPQLDRFKCINFLLYFINLEISLATSVHSSSSFSFFFGCDSLVGPGSYSTMAFQDTFRSLSVRFSARPSKNL